MENMNETLSDEMFKAYTNYLKQPLTRTFQKVSMIYSKGWVRITALCVFPPHEHRHYTFHEFLSVCENDMELFETFREDVDEQNS